MGLATLLSLEPGGLTWHDLIAIETFRQEALRLVVYFFTLGVAIMALSELHLSWTLLIAATFLVLVTIIYALYVVVETSRMLRGKAGDNRFKSWFFYSAIALLFIIFVAVIVRVDVSKFSARGKVS
jgi:heme O synthase-like polyprenyltransferase